MTDVQSKSIPEIEFYQGPHQRPDIRFRYAGKALGVTAWGMNVLELGPHCASYPEHDHLADGQEEVYVVLEGKAELLAEGLSVPLTAGTLVRVGPGTKRRITTGPEGATLLAIGATPGKAYGD